MKKHLEPFAAPFLSSQIPFLLVDVVTDGGGRAVDAICRFANFPAAALLGRLPDQLKNRRLLREAGDPDCLEALGRVAYGGSAATVPFVTFAGTALQLTCYQPVYGVAACILDDPRTHATERENPRELMAECLPGGTTMLALGRNGAKCFSFDRQFCALAGCTETAFSTHFSAELSAAAVEEDWPGLLQALLDGARENRLVIHEFRLRRRGGAPLWVELRAKALPAARGDRVFAVFARDVQRRVEDRAALTDLRRRLADLQPPAPPEGPGPEPAGD